MGLTQTRARCRSTNTALLFQAYQRAVTSNPDQLTAWQGLSKLYEKLVKEYKPDSTIESKDHIWNLNDVANAYSKILSLYSQTNNVEKYVTVSVKLVQLHQTKRKNLDDAVNVITERVDFLCDKPNENERLKDAYAELVRLISSEAQTNDVSDEKNAILCDALEKVV